jgi:hypothetical protein
MSIKLNERRCKIVFLCIATNGLMMIWGFTALNSHLRGFDFGAYWLVCLSLAFVALFAALGDLRVISARERFKRRVGEDQAKESEGLRSETRQQLCTPESPFKTGLSVLQQQLP